MTNPATYRYANFSFTIPLHPAFRCAPFEDATIGPPAHDLYFLAPTLDTSPNLTSDTLHR